MASWRPWDKGENSSGKSIRNFSETPWSQEEKHTVNEKIFSQ